MTKPTVTLEDVTRAQTDETYRNEVLWPKCRRLVYHYLFKQVPPGKNVEDYLSAAFIAFVDALRRYDPSRGAFSSCLFWAITAEMKKARGTTGYGSAQTYYEDFRLRVNIHNAGLKDEPNSVIAEKLGTTVKALEGMQSREKLRRPIRLKLYTNPFEDPHEHDPSEPPAKGPSPLERAEIVDEALSILSRIPEESRELVMEYALGSTWTDIGKRRGLGREAARQRFLKATRRIRR